MRKVHSSRRAAGLKPGDYDHQINLIDHEGSASRKPGPSEANGSERGTSPAPRSSNGGDQQRPSSRSDDDGFQIQERPAAELDGEQELPQGALRPSIEVQSINLPCLDSTLRADDVLTSLQHLHP